MVPSRIQEAHLGIEGRTYREGNSEGCTMSNWEKMARDVEANFSLELRSIEKESSDRRSHAEAAAGKKTQVFQMEHVRFLQEIEDAERADRREMNNGHAMRTQELRRALLTEKQQHESAKANLAHQHRRARDAIKAERKKRVRAAEANLAEVMSAVDEWAADQVALAEQSKIEALAKVRLQQEQDSE